MAMTLGFKKPIAGTDFNPIYAQGGTDANPTPAGGTDAGGTDAGGQPPAAGGNFMTPENINQGITNLKFGQAPIPITAPTITPVSGGAPAGMVPTAQQAAAPAAAVGAVPVGASAAAGQASAAQAGYAPGIKAPHVTAEQGGFTDFQALQNAMYHSQFDPVEQELTRQQGLADEQLKATLAKAGLASSGTGVGQVARQDLDFYRQMRDASSNAAQQASVQRYGMEYTQSMANAHLRQEANLANAGFDFNAQVENAKNILTVNITNAQMATDVSKTNAGLETQANIASAANQTQASVAGAQNQTAASIASMNAAADIAKANATLGTQASIAGAGNVTQYGLGQLQYGTQSAIAQAGLQLQAMGLNVQQAQQARGDFLQLLGIQETDLARMDRFNLENTSMLYNTYLAQLGIMTQAGDVSFGRTDASQSSTGVQVGGGLA